MIKAYGYARISTPGQDLNLQIKQIKEYAKFREIELVGLFQDTASGKDINRTDFQKMIKTLESNPQGVNAVIITKLDRMGRSLLDLINTTRWLESQQIGLISITNSIDTTTKEGRLFFYIMGALGEYERELIMERTQLGRLEAIKAGKKMGRPEIKINVDEIKRLLAEGVPKSAIARKFGVHRTTIYEKLNGAKHNNRG